MKRADLIRLLAIGKGKLQMQEEDYREMLRRHGATLIERKGLQVYSASKMTFPQLESALAELKSKGFAVTGKNTSTLTTIDWRQPRIRFIKDLWAWLHAAGQVRNPSEDALLTFCHQHMQSEKLEWANSKELNNCVEALKGWQARTKTRS